MGLCCEAAARLQLCTDIPFSLNQIADNGEADAPTPEETAFFKLREHLFDLAQRRFMPLSLRMQSILAGADAYLPEKDGAFWADFYGNLERLDNGWDTALQALKTAPKTSFSEPFSQQASVFFENLLCVFLYRHLAGALDDGNLAARTAFAVHGVQLLWALYRVCAKDSETFDVPLALDLVRQYSAEIEYSDENLQAIFHILSADC